MCDLVEHYIINLKHLFRYIKLLRLTKIIYKPNSSTKNAINLRNKLYNFTYKAFLKSTELRKYINIIYANDK